MLPLLTERLVLKPHTIENLDLYYAWENDPVLLYYSDNQPEDRQMQTLEEAREVLERIIPLTNPNGRILHFAIHTRLDDAFIGFGMIALIDHTHHSCRLGIAIGDPLLWGYGFGRETIAAVTEACFTRLNMNRVGAEVYDFNERSLRLFDHLGYRREGVIRQAVWKRGRYADEVIFGLLRSEWESQSQNAGKMEKS